MVGRGRTVSRVLYPLRDGDHLSTTPIARRLQRPIPEGSASHLIALLFGLAPGGVCLAGRSPGRRWALAPPFHPYRVAPAVSFLWHFPSGCPDWVLPSALPCGARTFLRTLRSGDRPSASTRLDLTLSAPWF